jgi:hypothetical protein
MKKLSMKLIGIGLTILLFVSCGGNKDKVATGNIFDESNLSDAEKMIIAAQAN